MVSEWFKEPVLKTGDPARDRGFESHLLRQQRSAATITVPNLSDINFRGFGSSNFWAIKMAAFR